MHRISAGFRTLPMVMAALFLGSALPASAAPLVQSERLTYNLMLGGLHVGDALVALKQDENGYSTTMKMTARGVASWIQNFRADLKGEGSIGAAAADGRVEIVPQNFMRQWSAGEVAADMTMTFNPQTREASVAERMFNPLTGEAIKREDMPWNKRREKLKPVPNDLRKNALDPMAAFVAARSQLMAQGFAGTAPKTFRVPIYDGTRRYDLVGKAGAVRTVSINGVERRLLPVTAKVEPVFGFNRESEERMRESEGKFLFTPDERFIPVQLIVGNDMFTSVMNLAADCSEDTAPCDAFGKQEAAAN
ncbi:MAG: DUF3108 domain-containing protein [Rhodospirillaceae bacterium]|nr:DUF3108 domain-containing protein [Rhodospirillaceae bacterium]